MQRLPPLPTIQEIIRIYGLSARKKLSQNFLLDLNLTNKIVRSAGKLDGGTVVEVGPGPGGITRSLLNSKASRVVVIEKDGRFIPSLQTLAEASKHRLEVIKGDILDFQLKSILPLDSKTEWKESPPNLHIVGNLPFSVSTPLIIRWLHQISKRSDAWALGRTPLTLTFQKEVAERIIAPPKSEYRCRLSIMCQYLCQVRLKFTIPGRAFVPPPKVDVGVVKFVPLKEPLIHQPFPLIAKVNRHLFSVPNKFWSNAIRSLFPVDREDLCCEIFETTGLDPEIRPFEMSVDSIRKLCDSYAVILDREPSLFDYDYREKQNAKARRQRNTYIIAIEDKLLNTCTPNESCDSNSHGEFQKSDVSR